MHETTTRATEVNYAFGLRTDPGTAPLVIGIAGHRDPSPDSLPRIIKYFDELIEILIHRCPTTPIWMLNGLATGMDTIAAEIFLRRARQVNSEHSNRSPLELDKLIAVLPKTPEKYSGDFANSNELQRFNYLLDRSHAILSPHNTPDLRTHRGTEPGEPECYALQGHFLSQYSYLLFAFFDGNDTGRLGGTGQTLAIHQGLVHPLFHSTEEILRSREPGEAIIIHTPRASSKLQTPSSLSSSSRINPSSSISKSLTQTCIYLEAANKWSLDSSFCATQYDEVEGRFTKLWSYADRAAGEHKRKYENIAVLLVIMGFILVAIAEVSGEASALGWGLVLIAFAIFPNVQKRLQKPFLINRCLAESLTIQYIWSSFSIRRDVADLLLSHNQDELNKIRVILRSVSLQLRISALAEAPDTSLSTVKAQTWIKGQINFLEKRIKQFKRLSKKWRATGYFLAGSAIATALLQLLPLGIEWIGSVVPIFLAGFASSLAYQELMGYEDTCERYEISLLQFRRALDAMNFLHGSSHVYEEEIDDPYYRHRLVVQAIGEEKIDELNEWMSNQLESTYQPG